MFDKRWEYGSDFHWPTPEEIGMLSRPQSLREKANEALFYGSGRAALSALLNHGRIHRGWQRLFLPTYFCPEVLRAVELAGIRLCYYPDSPIKKAVRIPDEKLSSEDVVLRVNYFGWRGAEWIIPSSELGCDIVEDHTHDPIGPWAKNSKATFCFASLRKTYPIPDGAVLWSPQGLELPESPPISKEHISACYLKLAGMVLKQSYVNGAMVEKNRYRELLIEGEMCLGRVGVSGMSPVSSILMEVISQDKLRRRRLENFRSFMKLNSIPESKRLDVDIPKDAAPFCIVLFVQDKRKRDLVREQLIQKQVYPGILWELPDDSDKEANDFSSRMLSLPCDFRYGGKDLERLSHLLQTVLS
jgi:hypothetical protein